MKRANTTKRERSKYKGFYTAIGISILMIGAACVYAYQVTNETNEALEEGMSQIAELTQPTTNFIAEVYDTLPAETTQPDYNAVAGVQTDVPMESEETEESESVETIVTETERIEEESEDSENSENSEEPVEVEEESMLSHVLTIPVDGEVAKPFSNGELVKSETTGSWQTHNGVDILAEKETPVRVMDNGTVVEIVKDPLWGICVSVDHENGIVSRYCNLSPNVGVQEGDTVESGQTIGTVGDSADMESKMESHLHFEITKGGVYIDPYTYIKDAE